MSDAGYEEWWPEGASRRKNRHNYRRQILCIIIPSRDGLYMQGFVTTDEAARRLGVSPRRVVDMLTTGQLAGEKVHRSWLVSAAAVDEREHLSHAPGRPVSAVTARALVTALSDGSRLTSRQEALIRRRTTEQLVTAVSRSVRIERFATRRPELAAEHLHLTGESAIARLGAHAGEALVGQAKQTHGYPRGMTYDELVDHAMLVPDDENGRVVLHRFDDEIFPWPETPRALIAIDAARDDQARVRTAGLDAVERLRSSWLADRT
ncbi:helix-turn-helix domain-containing protein [Rathayibacter sp. VKM Ac-2754]|uniref:helix-turn-helix domain-containing protein n=1 Tax=Rathayibacter sp. VKM Ac-2754 TaxID=2609251 RepID=UPI00135C5F45|nr:helix-turn-helix domain-containing protein [Rathayibacter sp. VKM Ac-2754]MWV57777.1 helix-turn-helix domain-containing protein [Rathayibacter sp. VKM Ac-2754]